MRHERPASYSLEPIGFIRSDLKRRDEAPRQRLEGASDAWLEVSPCFAEGLQGIVVGQEIIIVTWLHEARRDKLTVHPRGDESSPLTGVFSTRSPNRPIAGKRESGVYDMAAISGRASSFRS